MFLKTRNCISFCTILYFFCNNILCVMKYKMTLPSSAVETIKSWFRGPAPMRLYAWMTTRYLVYFFKFVNTATNGFWRKKIVVLKCDHWYNKIEENLIYFKLYNIKPKQNIFTFELPLLTSRVWYRKGSLELDTL